ncbi:MAG: metallophosphoesterase [Bacteroidota bacterium]
MNNKSLKQERRSFLKSSLALGAVTLLAPSKAIAAMPAHEDSFKIIAGPCLQTSFKNTMSIIWLTNKNAASWVEYGTDPTNLDKNAYGKSEIGLKPIGRINTIKLEQLQPGTKYYYRVVSKEIKDFQPYKLTYGEVVSTNITYFTNLDIAKDEVSFLMLNDIHDRPKSIPHLLDLDKEQKNDFIFFNGDIFDYQTDEQQIIDHFLQPCTEAFAKNIPFVYVRGNHETRGKYCREFPQYFENVGYDAFTLGPVRFVILDTGEDKEDTHPVYAGIVDFDAYRVQQAELLKAEIASKAFKKAPFRVVFMHIPPRFSGDWHGPLHCTKVFEPLLNQGKVDLVLSGHTHKYMIHQPNKAGNSYPLIIGGGPKEGSRTLTKITANQNELKVLMLDDSGKEVGHYTAKRK